MLAKIFIAQFASSRQYSKDLDDLYWIQPRQGEPLRNYIQSFNDTKVKIINYWEVVSCNAFQRGLVPGTQLYIFLTRKKPRTMLEALQWAQTYVTLEEEMKEDLQKVGQEGQLVAKPTGILAHPDLVRSDRIRHDSSKDYHAEPKNNCPKWMFKDSRGNEDKRMDWFRKFNLSVLPNQLVA